VFTPPNSLLRPPERVEDDDEVLLAMAESLGGSFVEAVGGPAHAHLLLGPLASLAAVEETVVRDRAVESAAEVIALLDVAAAQNQGLALIANLAGGDWFSSKVSAAGLLPSVFARCTGAAAEGAAAEGSLAARRELLSLFQKL
jgi:serine/threonine-protein phosphatase 2A regulatory subunit A